MLRSRSRHEDPVLRLKTDANYAQRVAHVPGTEPRESVLIFCVNVKTERPLVVNDAMPRSNTHSGCFA